MKAAAITFDVTGTLLHSPRLATIYAEVLGRHGVTADPELLAGLIRQVWQEFACTVTMGQDRFVAHPEGARGWWQRFLERLCEHLGAPPPSPFAAAELFARFARPDAWEVFPEVRPTLEALRRQGLALAVISNWDHRLPDLLAELGLAELLDAVVFSADVGVEKPHPRIFEAALARLAVPAEATVHVGDRMKEDVEGALAVGMEALLLVRRRPDDWSDSGGSGGDLPDLTPLPEIVEVSRAPGPFPSGA